MNDGKDRSIFSAITKKVKIVEIAKTVVNSRNTYFSSIAYHSGRSQTK